MKAINTLYAAMRQCPGSSLRHPAGRVAAVPGHGSRKLTASVEARLC
jgi:hypothetical protein